MLSAGQPCFFRRNKMKKFIPLLLLLLCLCLPALAEEARDMTADCEITLSPGKYKTLDRICDRDWHTIYLSNKMKNPTVTVQAPKGEDMYGVYVCFGDKLAPWQVQAKHDGKWVTVYESEGLYAHEFAPLEGERQIRILPKSTKSTTLCIGELFVYGEGELPSTVQFWQPAPEKADLLLLSAHPDDEMLFFGGTIPYYAGEKGMDVVVVYMTCNLMERRSELLNGLWACGVKTYPVIGDFYDKYATKVDKIYDAWGKSASQKFVVEQLRRFKPDVVLTHDVNGEYGHGAHKTCADLMQKCIATAANPDKFTDTAKAYGTWEVKKLYLHLYKENQIEMDWDQPLAAFNGKTGYEMAQEGYSWHFSQHDQGQKNKQTGEFEYFIVEPRDSDYSCYRFGLVHTTVGEDVEKNDFFENIPVE